MATTWTEDFPGWEHGTYRDHAGVYRRRADGLSVRVLRELPPVPAPVDLGGQWPPDRSWLVSFWRRRDSQSFNLVGPDAPLLAEVLGLDAVGVTTILVELNRRVGVLAWPAGSPGFEWTGELVDGATPPDRAPADWLDRLVGAGWSAVMIDDAPMAELRTGTLVIRVGVDEADPGAPYVPQCWFLEFAAVDQGPLRRVFSGGTLTPAGELYATPWRDAEMILDHLTELPPATDVDGLRSWLQASTDSAVEYVAPGRTG